MVRRRESVEKVQIDGIWRPRDRPRFRSLPPVCVTREMLIGRCAMNQGRGTKVSRGVAPEAKSLVSISGLESTSEEPVLTPA